MCEKKVKDLYKKTKEINIPVATFEKHLNSILAFAFANKNIKVLAQ